MVFFNFVLHWYFDDPIFDGLQLGYPIEMILMQEPG